MVTNEQKLTLVRGIPGSGKSTHAKTLDAKLVEADQFFIDKDGLYQYDNAQIKNAHNWCKLETTRLLKAGFNVVVANTFVKNWEMKFYQNLANDMELAFEVIEMKGVIRMYMVCLIPWLNAWLLSLKRFTQAL